MSAPPREPNSTQLDQSSWLQYAWRELSSSCQSWRLPLTSSQNLPGLRTEALAFLRQALRIGDAEFRQGQWEAVSALVQRQAKLLVVQRTGWGKSLIYFLATKFLRERGAGCTLLISPLLSLMRNQIAAARNVGVEARTINSSNQEHWLRVEGRMERDQIGDVRLPLRYQA